MLTLLLFIALAIICVAMLVSGDDRAYQDYLRTEFPNDYIKKPTYHNTSTVIY